MDVSQLKLSVLTTKLEDLAHEMDSKPEVPGDAWSDEIRALVREAES